MKNMKVTRGIQEAPDRDTDFDARNKFLRRYEEQKSNLHIRECLEVGGFHNKSGLLRIAELLISTYAHPDHQYLHKVDERGLTYTVKRLA
jgi:hypothetical protein